MHNTVLSSLTDFSPLFSHKSYFFCLVSLKYEKREGKWCLVSQRGFSREKKGPETLSMLSIKYINRIIKYIHIYVHLRSNLLNNISICYAIQSIQKRTLQSVNSEQVSLELSGELLTVICPPTPTYLIPTTTYYPWIKIPLKREPIIYPIVKSSWTGTGTIIYIL